MKLFLGVAVICLAGSILLLGFAAPHMWSNEGKTSAAEKDGSEIGATVYRSKGGDFLIAIEGASPEAYIFSPANGSIGIPNGNQFAFIPFFAYSKDVPVPVVFSYNKVKVETDMGVSFENGMLKFTTLQGRRVTFDLIAFGIPVKPPQPHGHTQNISL
ncbi:MAG: hypothetical protein ABJA02_04115 [Acidobacteriota bacterium]